ncbi:MAG: valine--tRNA ligase [Gemmatimonadetes bacterium]|nr:valine--tRNA ligase [Gemmatimonadota bacterium]
MMKAPALELSPVYDPSQIESPLYRRWESAGYFRADARSAREPYVIVIPPPNVTGVLHMGHALNNTLQDLLIRWQRMRGRAALWVPGTDHAGIATQNVVERQLAQEGKSRWDLGREAFEQRVWSWVQETGGVILEQLKALGCSCDWSRARFTLEPQLSRAVREVFVRLYEKGLVYRGRYMIHWCPRCLTALSDEEVEHQEVQGKLYYLRYPLEGGPGQVVVATTRPETMLGDTAVAVHRDDERYRGLIGRTARLPLAERVIPIIADESVDPAFGTGAVKVTPAHDPSDFRIAQRHGLPEVDVMNPDGTMGAGAPPAFQGLDRFEARKAVLHALSGRGLVERVQDHVHAVGHCYRCAAVVEPRLSEQWFVRMAPLAAPALQVYRDGIVRFVPERWGGVYAHWLENIRDWCISRQLWWGHRIPVWYCDACGHQTVSRTDPASCEGCGRAELRQDPDVLDTWFSSWLWPFSVFGWPEDSEDLRTFYPTHTLVTGSEIIFFWVARMIMAGLEFMGDVPFRDVYINGTVRDHLGRRMSKSLGNGIDPLEVIGLFGADALRYTAISKAATGVDIHLNYQNLGEAFAPGRNFTNKIWNAARFALPHITGDDVPRLEPGMPLEFGDRWILSRLNAAVRDVTDALSRYRFHDAAGAGYRFFWGELCDWYLELAKPRLYGDATAESRAAARAALRTAFDGAMKILHPVLPFVTEEIWLRLPHRAAESLVVAAWPEPDPAWDDARAEAHMAALQEVVSAVRAIRAEYNVAPGEGLEVWIRGAGDDVRAALAQAGAEARRLAGVARWSFDHGAERKEGATAVLSSGAEVFVSLRGVIDLTRERARLDAKVGEIEGRLRTAESRLGDPAFVERAPAEVVERERERAKALREQFQTLARKREALG